VRGCESSTDGTSRVVASPLRQPSRLPGAGPARDGAAARFHDERRCARTHPRAVAAQLVMAPQQPSPAAERDDVRRVRVTDYLTFYEIVDGVLLRRMEPIELVYRRSGGGGPTLVCLHSVTAASGFADGLVQALDGRADVLAVDLRGFGASPRPTHEYTVDLWVEDVLKLLAEAGCESPPIIYGHGLGACIAVALAARGVGGGLAVSGVALAPGEPAALAPLSDLAERGDDLLGPLGELTGVAPAGEDLTPQIVARCIGAWRAFDGIAPAEGLAVPSIVFSAADDRVAALDAVGGPEWLAETAGARRISLLGGHELPRAQPQAMARALTDWFDEVEVR